MFTRVIDTHPTGWHWGAAIEMSAQATQPGRSIGVIEPKIALPRVQPDAAQVTPA
jgi:hypothetical protein